MPVPVTLLNKQCLAALLFFVLLFTTLLALAEKIVIQDVRGEGKIRVDSFTDSDFPSVNCHLAQSVVPGISKLVGSGEKVFAIDISCSSSSLLRLSARQQRVHNGEEVYMRETTTKRHALLVKRYIDAQSKHLVYVFFNNKLTGEAPLVAVSTVQFVD